MNTNKKLLSGIILGVVIGTAIILLTQTEKGKGILSDLGDTADDVKDNLKDKKNSFDKQFKELIKKGKSFIEDLEDKAKDIASSIKN